MGAEAYGARVDSRAVPIMRATTLPPGGSPMIEVSGVCKSFGETQALASVDLVAEQGKVLGLLGPNGAGKTTLVRILATLLKPDSGRASVAGCDVVDDAGQLRSLIGLTGQFAAVDELLTGRENLELVGLFYRLDQDERRRQAQDVLERVSREDAADKLVKTYSGGMGRRLDVGASLVGRPRVLFLDEPTTGLDPRTRNDVWRFIEELVAGGTTVLLTTQYMEEAEHLAHRIVVIDAGQVVAQGTAGELKDRLGGDVLEARVASPGDLDRAAALMAEVSQGVPRVDPDQRSVSVPSKGATEVLIAAGRRLQEDGIALADLGIRHPSLDDVFLSLTGKTASVQADSAVADGGAANLPHAEPRPQSMSKRRAPRVTWPTVAATRDTAGVTKRNLLRMARTPRLLVISALQPAMLLVLFRYVLGGAIRIPGGNYVDYIVPAIFIEAVMIGGMATAIGLADDLRSGIIDRFRSLPMARSAVLAGRTLADLARSVLSLALMVGLGLLVGFRFHGSIGGILAGLVIVIVFGYCFSWVYATIGLLTKDPETAQVAGILPFFVLVFASSAIVPVATMPGWLQPFARHQPVSVTINAVRALLGGEPTHHWVWQSLAWSAGILLVFFMLAVRLYRNVTA
ncbi:MAG: ATP-binding cassette domain-containing protein [Solirubrobacterales bacterium]